MRWNYFETHCTQMNEVFILITKIKTLLFLVLSFKRFQLNMEGRCTSFDLKVLVIWNRTEIVAILRSTNYASKRSWIFSVWISKAVCCFVYQNVVRHKFIQNCNPYFTFYALFWWKLVLALKYGMNIMKFCHGV